MPTIRGSSNGVRYSTHAQTGAEEAIDEPSGNEARGPWFGDPRKFFAPTVVAVYDLDDDGDDDPRKVMIDASEKSILQWLDDNEA